MWPSLARSRAKLEEEKKWQVEKTRAVCEEEKLSAVAEEAHEANMAVEMRLVSKSTTWP